jgi:hypothetical protein
MDQPCPRLDPRESVGSTPPTATARRAGATHASSSSATTVTGGRPASGRQGRGGRVGCWERERGDGWGGGW